MSGMSQYNFALPRRPDYLQLTIGDVNKVLPHDHTPMNPSVRRTAFHVSAATGTPLYTFLTFNSELT